MRARLHQRFKNLFEHRLSLLKRFVVPKAQYAKADARKITRSLEVFEQAFRVLPSIELDDQPRA